MNRRNKRILWLLNHKTLMAFELELLMELGFEVFTPKIIPTAVSFRSGHVDFRYDSGLTIPDRVLRRMNTFNFYEEIWPPDIVAMINRYFGSAFFMPIKILLKEVLNKFEGQLLLRAFGLYHPNTYASTLPLLYNGFRIKLAEIESRFWFAQGYEQLAEVEPSFFAERAIFLPVGVPQSFFESANSFTGGDSRLIFLCPNCVTNPYDAATYGKFKAELGDLPHLIVGVQDVPVDDPHVLGYISDNELNRIYRECSLLYYQSTEPRHVHYSPIEAVIKGMPVVYYADSLLGRLSPSVSYGRCRNLKEARACVERILGGDKEYIAAMRVDQRKLLDYFSYDNCKELWRNNLTENGYSSTILPETPLTVLAREAKRTLLQPFAHGLSCLPKETFALASPWPRSHFSPDGIPDMRTFADGVDFTDSSYPWFIEAISGLSGPEPGGRWSIGPTIKILFTELLPKEFQILIQGGAHHSNVMAPIKVTIGKDRRTFTFPHEPGGEQITVLNVSLKKPTRLIEITVPKPVMPPGDNRLISIALRHLKILTKPENEI